LAADLGLFGGQISSVERSQIRRFHQSSMKVEFSHKPLRLQLAHLESQGTQEHQKHVYTSKLSARAPLKTNFGTRQRAKIREELKNQNLVQ